MSLHPEPVERIALSCVHYESALVLDANGHKLQEQESNLQ